MTEQEIIALAAKVPKRQRAGWIRDMTEHNARVQRFMDETAAEMARLEVVKDLQTKAIQTLKSENFALELILKAQKAAGG